MSWGTYLRLSKGELAAILYAMDRFPWNQYEDRAMMQNAASAFCKMVDAAPREMGYDGGVFPLLREAESEVRG